MTDLRPETHYISKAQLINDAIGRSQNRPVGVIMSTALRDEIRATGGWVMIRAYVDPKFQPSQFEVLTSESIWEERIVDLKEADLVPHSSIERALTRTGVLVFTFAVIGLRMLGYYVFFLR
jgi:hypothetical protein